MSRIGTQAHPRARRRRPSPIEPELVRVNGPEGELSERIHRDITVAQDGRRSSSSRARPTAASTARCTG